MPLSLGDFVAIGVLLLTTTVASMIADRARRRAEAAEHASTSGGAQGQRDASRIRLREAQASRARVIQAADQERRRGVRPP